MYNSLGRYVLMAVFLLTALVCMFVVQYELAAVAGFLFVFVIWSHFRHSSVLMASKHFKNNEFGKAKLMLAEVPNPERLSKNRRGYYEFMRANIALQQEDFETAEFRILVW